MYYKKYSKKSTVGIDNSIRLILFVFVLKNRHKKQNI